MQAETLRPLTKEHRIATRVSKEHKSLFEYAANVRGISLTDFIINAAYEAAMRTFKESEHVLKLSSSDTRYFLQNVLKAFENPAQDAPNLHKAIQDYQTLNT
jgi:uncharacterized protein (DUF1778 family)